MTKRDCINYCVQKMREMWDNRTTFDERTVMYNDCKDVCKANGYTGGAFVGIWNAACREKAIADGVYTPGRD